MTCFAPEFFEEPEVIFVSDSDSACSVVVDQPTNLGDELDDSSNEETNVETCQLWNSDFGWVYESTLPVDSNLMCGMFSAGATESSGTVQTAMHPQVTFDCGLQCLRLEVVMHCQKIFFLPIVIEFVFRNKECQPS